MKTYIITITEPAPESIPTTTATGVLASFAGYPVEHYRRRVEFDDIAPAIQRLDESLNVKTRKRRSDAGTTKTA